MSAERKFQPHLVHDPWSGAWMHEQRMGLLSGNMRASFKRRRFPSPGLIFLVNYPFFLACEELVFGFNLGRKPGNKEYP